MFQALIKFILSKLAGITDRQWATVLQLVIMAAKDVRYKTGAERKEAVKDHVLKHWPDIKGYALNLLIEVAVAFQRSK